MRYAPRVALKLAKTLLNGFTANHLAISRTSADYKLMQLEFVLELWKDAEAKASGAESIEHRVFHMPLSDEDSKKDLRKLAYKWLKENIQELSQAQDV